MIKKELKPETKISETSTSNGIPLEEITKKLAKKDIDDISSVNEHFRHGVKL